MNTPSQEQPHRHVEFSPYPEFARSTDSEPVLHVEDFIEQPEEVREFLEEYHALDFRQYATGLFPACELSPEVAMATGMDKAWLRDNAHIAHAHLEAGDLETAGRVGLSMLQILKNNSDRISGINDGSIDTLDRTQRITVRVVGDSLENDTEPRVQNDSVGYALWFIGRCVEEGALSDPTQEDLEILASTVQYLQTVEYWQDPEEGHWEEDMRIQASSIGVAVAGIQATKQVFDSAGYDHGLDIETLMQKGRDVIDDFIRRGIASISPNLKEPIKLAEYEFDDSVRQVDASMLFLVEPLNILTDEQKEIIVSAIETTLKGDIGFNRYEGDTYYGLGQSDTLSPDEITRNGGDELINRRNENALWNAYTGKEAQWTLFDSVLSTYYGKKYLAHHNPKDREQQLHYLNRTMAQFVQEPDGRLILPELFYMHNREVDNEGRVREIWTPNEHRPLLWSQANLMQALHVFEAVKTEVA